MTSWQQDCVVTCYEQSVLVLMEQLVASLLPSSTLSQQLGTGSANAFWYKMIMIWSRLVKNWEEAVQTHPVDKLWDFYACTQAKISHLVTGLPTSRQHVFALLVTSCQQLWNNMWTTCNNLVEIIKLVARLFWQVRYMLDITRLLQPCVDNLVTSLLYHGCNKLVSTVL